jgi:hypothetical protein
LKAAIQAPCNTYNQWRNDMATSKRQTVKSMLRQNYEAGVKPRIRMQATKPEMNLDAHSSGHQFDKTKGTTL